MTEVPLESIIEGNRYDLYSTWGQHFWHCAFYQRKFFRVVEESGDDNGMQGIGRKKALKMTEI